VKLDADLLDAIDKALEEVIERNPTLTKSP
jgi:hypothetical protein